MTFRTQMLEEMGEDSFVMWDTSDDEKATLWGGVMTATAVRQEACGRRASTVASATRTRSWRRIFRSTTNTAHRTAASAVA